MAQPFSFPRSWRARDGALATIMEVGRESTLFPCPWRAKEGALPHHDGDRLRVNSFYKVYQLRSLPTQDHGASKRELCHHHGDGPPVNSFFTRCARGAAFLPKIMEGPRGSSAIIMEISRSSILSYRACHVRNIPTVPKIMESSRGSSIIIMEISAQSILLFACEYVLSQARTASWGCGLVEKNGHVRDMTYF